MTYQSTDIYVVDAVSKSPVEGVLVRVFSETNKSFFNQDVTDVLGRVGFTLFIGKYNLRFYKFGAQVKQPQLIEVIEPPYGAEKVNAFEVKATVFSHPLANDARLCRASGYFRDVTGAPRAGLELSFIPQFNPILLEGSGVLGERKTLRTDKDGFACVDLIRCALYTASVPAMEDIRRSVSVPDAPSANLPDLILPVVQKITFDPVGPYTLKVEKTLELTPTVLASSGVPLVGTASSDVKWSSSDETVLVVDVSATTLVLRARAKGEAELRATRADNSIIQIPDLYILGVPQVVTVV